MTTELRGLLQKQKFGILTQSEYDELQTKKADKLYVVHNCGKVNVVLDANGGSVDKNTLECYSGATIPSFMVPTPVFADYNFTGWFTDKYSGVQFIPEHTVVQFNKLYARWNWTKGNRVIFFSNDHLFLNGTHESVKTVSFGDPITSIPTDFDNDILFAGFYYNGIKMSAGFIPTTDMYVEARFRQAIRMPNGTLLMAPNSRDTAKCMYNGQWYFHEKTVEQLCAERGMDPTSGYIRYGTNWTDPGNGNVYSYKDGWCIYLCNTPIYETWAINIVTGEEVKFTENLSQGYFPKGSLTRQVDSYKYNYHGGESSINGGFVWTPKVKYDGVTYVNTVDVQRIFFHDCPGVPEQSDSTIIRLGNGTNVSVSDNKLLEFPE